ncbi:oxygenase MpaB family protein [Luteipulveratus halotolerans]|uniref:ER-bound oxygenase mpaB/mpaB'/Rubber oxygenase catalytic domain-containing protein n=1 Tax=Luteipulveratus halotolerans TaxID=1631356 RepID=A0A0L6CMF3_9MICO|nr:oxygenase MpaB family protein [Luteipulveratus halotolerans]KNX38946.1 hypothetical protein VV01_20330 [Luteipulveratus halotolerans]
MTAPARTTTPTRHREAEARGARLGRTLRRFSGLQDEPVDEQLLDRLGEALLERDELGAVLATAMRFPAGDPDRVTRADLRAALESDGEVHAPASLAVFMAEVRTPPRWVDWDRVDAGARAFSRLGRNAGDVLLQLSLIGGYRFGGPTDLLVATGGLTGDDSLRRLAETQDWTLGLARPRALRPGGDAWRQTVHVRVMHALVNASYENDPSRWDIARWGLPINQADQAGTLGLFDATLLVGCRALGVPVSRADADDLLHLWKYVGWLMGVHADFLTDDERERNRINLHLLLAAAEQTAAGRELAASVVSAQTSRDFGSPTPWRARVHGRYEQERLLSMLTAFLGVRSMRELGLPVRPPWAFGARAVGNVWRYRVVGRGARGRRALEQRGRAQQERVVASYAHAGSRGVAALPE